MLAQNIMKLLQKYGINFLNGLGTTLLLALICYLLLESQAKKLRAKNEAAM